MAVQLSTTNSIMDFLSTQGKDPSFSARKKLYNEMGLNTRLGDYVGSSAQNTNFLNALKTPTPAPESPFVPGNSPLKLPETQPALATNAVNVATQPTPSIAQPTLAQAGVQTQPPVAAPQPTTATQALGAFGYTPPAPLTPEKALATAEASPQAQLAGEERDIQDLIKTGQAEAEKQQLQTEYNTAVDKIENDYNLSFSGRRGQALQDLATNLATSTLGVDRELAGQLLLSDVNARQKMLGMVEDVIKQASENDKSALDQINKAGFSITPDGVVRPTIEALRLSETAGTAEFNKMIQMERLKISAQNAATSKERNMILNQMRMVNLQKQTSVSPGQVINKATGLPVDLTQGESEMISRQQMVDNYYIPSLLTKLDGVETGAVAGKVNKYTAKMPVAQYLRNEDLSMFNAMASYMSQQIVYMNSGKQINEAEMKILQQSLPNAELTVAENKARLEQFKALTGQTLNTLFNANGWTTAPSTDTTNDIINQEAGADDFTEIDDWLNSF